MGLLSRFVYLTRSKLNAVLDRSENPDETLEYAYEQLRDEVQEVRSSISDVATEKTRLEQERARLEQDVETHNEQARDAVSQGDDDLAEAALQKKQEKLAHVERLDEQIQSLEQTQESLVKQKNDLEEHLTEFKTRKETMKARHSAAETQVAAKKSIPGQGGRMSEASCAIENAQDELEEMEARDDALSELADDEEFTEQPLSTGGRLDDKLDALSVESHVNEELETLKREYNGNASDDNTAETRDPSDNEDN